MINFTKRNVVFLSLISATIIFILFHLIWHLLFFEKSKKVYSATIKPSAVTNILQNTLNQTTVEAKKIQTSKSKTSKQNISKSIQNLVQSAYIEKTQKTLNSNISEKKQEKTAREIIQENKNNTWRIQIPKINLDVHIAEGISSDVLLTAVGHFEQTSKWQGNVGLAAHNRGYQCNFFQNIKNLKAGDEIIYTVTNGKKVYEVQTNKVILETDWTYLQPTSNNVITLITCEENRKEYRRCIQAVEISSYIT